MTKFDVSAHLGYLFTELPLRARFAAAARAGFRFIEHPSPYDLPADEFRALCAENDLAVTQIALPAGGANAKGLAAIVGCEDGFRASLADGIVYAKTIGCPLIHPMSGVPTVGLDDDETWNCYLANIADTCRAARSANLAVIIEPIGAGTLAGYFMDHPAKALSTIECVGEDNLFLSFDAFHAAQCGVDPALFARQAGTQFRHVQVADTPGRHEPGTGTIDFDAFFEALIEVGYEGAIGLEYRPAITTEAGLDWTHRYARIADLNPRRKNESAATIQNRCD